MEPKDADAINMELMPFAHTLTFPLGGPTDTFVDVVPRAPLRTAVPGGLDTTHPLLPAMSTALPGMETPVFLQPTSLAPALANGEDLFAISLSTFHSLEGAMDELDDWPTFATEDAATDGSSPMDLYRIKDGNSLGTLGRPCPDSEASPSEPTTPNDEVDELATQLREIKGEQVGRVMEGLYRDLDKAAAEWSLVDDQGPEDTGDVMEALLREVDEAFSEWSVPSAEIDRA